MQSTPTPPTPIPPTPVPRPSDEAAEEVDLKSEVMSTVRGVMDQLSAMLVDPCKLSFAVHCSTRSRRSAYENGVLCVQESMPSVRRLCADCALRLC